VIVSIIGSTSKNGERKTDSKNRQEIESFINSIRMKLGNENAIFMSRIKTKTLQGNFVGKKLILRLAD